MIFYTLHPRWGNGDDEDEVKAEVCTAFYADITKKYLQYLLSITKITKTKIEKREMKREPQKKIMKQKLKMAIELKMMMKNYEYYIWIYTYV